LGSGYTQDSLILFLDISVRSLGEASHVICTIVGYIYNLRQQIEGRQEGVGPRQMTDFGDQKM
jgi:hypothetical protein